MTGPLESPSPPVCFDGLDTPGAAYIASAVADEVGDC